MRILIAEDDLTSRTMLAAVLKKAGHEVIDTVNGVEALQYLLQTDAPKLAILDFMMPEMDGLEVIRKLRAINVPQPTYIIMLTSKGEKRDIITGLDAGADDYLTKPFDVGELSARIEVGRRMVEMQAALIESRKALEYQATHDALTDLLNRRAILLALGKELTYSYDSGNRLIVAMIDIDHFKIINDTYGHQAGDDVLVELSRSLKSCLNNRATLGRFGGEEFLLIVPLSPQDEPQLLLDGVCKAVERTQMKTRSGTISITVSVGGALASIDNSVDDIIGAADTAMYKAKSAGRNCAFLSTECSKFHT